MGPIGQPRLCSADWSGTRLLDFRPDLGHFRVLWSFLGRVMDFWTSSTLLGLEEHVYIFNLML